jgi:signal transduction histidine kinase
MVLGGWLVAVVAVAVAVLAWRSLTARMDAVARACHELRGPLTAARLGLQLGTRAGQLSPMRLQAIDLELGRAALALDDLTGAAEPDCAGVTVDLRTLAVDCVEASAGMAASRGIALRLGAAAGHRGGGVIVVGHRLRLAQAIGNLVANAIVHGGGFVEVSCIAHAGAARIEVVDGGPGLPAPVAVLAGSPRRRRRRTGHGHGLAVAHAVAEAHGGRLASAPAERGARVVLELPLAAGPADVVTPG